VIHRSAVTFAVALLTEVRADSEAWDETPMIKKAATMHHEMVLYNLSGANFLNLSEDFITLVPST
jgi:hypothetical protein